MKDLSYAKPVLNCEQAIEFEASVLADEAAEWSAMKRAGQGIARLVVEDYKELCPVPEHLHILALIGKGNNGGDALLACGQLLADFPRACVDLILTTPADELRPLALRALQQLEGRVKTHQVSSQLDRAEIMQILTEAGGREGFHICLDGLVGQSFVPPMRQPMAALIEAVNAYQAINLRAAVDVPSGRGDVPLLDGVCFHAEFTYATGIAKELLFEGIGDCGRLRYVDLGFFETAQAKEISTKQYILTASVLEPIRRLRPTAVDKRHFGHLFIVGGSASMPGALLMAVQAAVRSGAGLVTAFAPEPMVAILAAQVPEAMWVPWPESANGTLSFRAMPLLMERISRASAIVVGPGMGGSRDVELITQDILERVQLPVLLDADALHARAMEVARKRKPHFGRVVLTPHMGEFMRIAKLMQANYKVETLLDFSSSYRVMTVLKGMNTRICDGKSVIFNTQGSPVLSRGGSGDILSGLIGGIMAQNDSEVEIAVAQGVMLHGLAAQRLARARGQVAVHTRELLNYLSDVLRN